ncbi:MAG: hypothetical protein LBI10_00790, partial [Deltaproteobacteria bacterium]|nr:hypothetical protein [Deltaproteobacteria bacterium]
MNWFSGRRREGAWLRKGPGLCLGALILVFGLGGFLAAQVWAADPPKSEKPMPQPYRSVKVIDKPRLWSPASDQVEVIYFFWYGCPTCKMIDGLVDELAARLPKEVKLTKLPMAFQENPEWQTHAKLF